MTPIRLTIVQTHPVQYNAPWFRHITAHCPEIDLTVVYASRPQAHQQGVGFDANFTWDTPLYEGYRWHLVRESRDGDDFGARRYRGLDVKGMGQALEATNPDVVLVPGWHSVTMMRSLLWARARGIPVLYRGDTNALTGPAGIRRFGWNAKAAALLSMYSGYLSVGTRSRDFLLAHGAAATRVFASPHAVDNPTFADGAAPYLTPEGRAEARARFGARDEDFVILLAGKLDARKRPLDAVRAAAALGPRTVLAIAGGGDLDVDVIEEASRLALRVALVGFINQSKLGRIYAAADCLVVPSETESWGLVVNEAMATGLPAVVSAGVGAAPDLIVAGTTGEVSKTGDVRALAGGLARVRDNGGRMGMGEACRAQVARNSFAAASNGLVAACASVADRQGAARVIACCGSMVIVAGLERMTFAVLGAVRSRGGTVHCIVNSWNNVQIVARAERAGATWSPGFYWYQLSRSLTLLNALQMVWEMCRTSLGLLGVAARIQPTHVLLPDYGTVLRNAPTLALLRLMGVRVILRLGNSPDEGRFFRLLWRRVINPVVSAFVCNSDYTRHKLLAHGVPERKVSRIYNAVPVRDAGSGVDAGVDARRVVYIGQIIPEKGLDVLLEALGLLVAKGIDVRLDVVGVIDGWVSPSYAGFREGLLARAAQPDLAQRVTFLGWREDVPDILRGAAVHCCPSQRPEGFGLVTLEAKVAGVPSVVTPVGALPELVTHGVDGWICGDLSAAAIADGLEHFVGHPDRTMAEGAAALAASRRFGREQFEQSWAAMFAERAEP